MDDLSGLLNQVLSDPKKMEELSSLAQSLGLSQPEPPTAAAPSSVPDGLDLGKLLALSGLGGSKDSRQEALLNALRPYLRTERQASLDRALRALRISKAARLALQALQDDEGNGHV